MGLPALVLGNSMMGIFILTMATAFAATGFGVTVVHWPNRSPGSYRRFPFHTFAVGIGRHWVPSYVMPEVMRNISAFSPLNWSLEGFYKLF
ncbi:MAG: hypothetical protein IPP81_04285 [Chitinophagaceae bacterium]|nr:hypothetical protein [Chitinophagaceae bacterium]